MRQKIIQFVNNKKQYPIITGVASGLYPMLYYYNSNFTYINSLEQFLFCLLTFLVIPIVGFYIITKLVNQIKILNKLAKFSLPILNACWFSLLMLVSSYGIKRRTLLLLVLMIATGVAIVVHKHYKKIVVLQFLMAVTVLVTLLPQVFKYATVSNQWMEQTDDITSAVFKVKPNIYVIQVDGYANKEELRKAPYNFDNSTFEKTLENKGFKWYANYRSNYYSTLSSNTSFFAMRHHYHQKPNKPYQELINSREIIVGENPVISILKKNNYKTHLLLEKPYFLVNRPKIAYDYCNISLDDVDYLGRGFEIKKDLETELNKLLETNKTSENFYFIQKLLPSHITNATDSSKDKETERTLYLKRLKEANVWLTELITNIEAKDKNALIVVSADHGGFVGFDTTNESTVKQETEALVKTIFTSTLAIKWSTKAPEFDDAFKTPVNFFRILFAHLSENRSYIEHLQDDKSYIIISKGAPFGVYEYIDENGHAVFNAIAND